jgi:hypothetical protein
MFAILPSLLACFLPLLVQCPSRGGRVRVLHEHPDGEMETFPVPGVQVVRGLAEGEAHLHQPAQNVMLRRAQVAQHAGLVVEKGQPEGGPVPRVGWFRHDPPLDPPHQPEGPSQQRVAPPVHVSAQKGGEDPEAGATNEWQLDRKSDEMEG